jgi:feruloyl-CoA synthase
MGALVWINAAAARSLGLGDTEIGARLQTALAALHAESTGGSSAPSRLFILELPPSIDEGEITDKGYINQRAVLERRAVHVEQLHTGGSEVIWPT